MSRVTIALGTWLSTVLKHVQQSFFLVTLNLLAHSSAPPGANLHLSQPLTEPLNVIAGADDGRVSHGSERLLALVCGAGLELGAAPLEKGTARRHALPGNTRSVPPCSCHAPGTVEDGRGASCAHDVGQRSTRCGGLKRRSIATKEVWRKSASLGRSCND